jgi:hypothetical protein
LASGTNAFGAAGSLIASSGNNFDSAIDIGNNAGGEENGAYAGAGSLDGEPEAGTNSYDTAIDIGNNEGSFSGSRAGASDFTEPASISGNGDTAYTFGNTDGVLDGAYADAGDNNYASHSGDVTGSYDYSYAGNGNGNSAIDDTGDTTTGNYVEAEDGNNNYAYVYGPDNSTAGAYDGNGNIAYVDDPFGTASSPDSAYAGDGFNSDLAAVLFTHGNALATGADYAYDIISPLGPEAGTAAATSGSSFLSELLALF